MTLTLTHDPVPLRQDPSGDYRIGETRVLLELVIWAFEDGDTPEAIVSHYPTLLLSDVYAVVAYYLRHRDEVDDYLQLREEQALEVRSRIESGQPDLTAIRDRLLARRPPKIGQS